nr:hypothetical protein [Tanacetum cinerariifolium]
PKEVVVRDKNVPNEVASNTPRSFPSLVCNEAGSRKVNFQSFEIGKLTNEKAEVKIPLSSILEVHSRFGFSLYGYFVGKRVSFSVVENYVRNAWKKCGIVRVMMNAKGFFFFKFSLVEGTNQGNSNLVGYGANKDNVGSSSKGPMNSNDISLVDLRNSFEALKENDNVIMNVGTSIAEKFCNTINDSEKFVDESESDV